MIFDRTQNDIDAAILLRKEKVQRFQNLTESEIAILEKGSLTINTLNRIENKCQELRQLLIDIFYFTKEIISFNWTYTDYFKQEDFERIVLNIENLKEAFLVYSYTPKITDRNFLKYQVMNVVEKNLYDLETMVNDIKSNYRECGATETGEI